MGHEEDIMRLLLLRHGQSEADILKVMEGRADFSLTDKGKIQARKAAVLKGK